MFLFCSARTLASSSSITTRSSLTSPSLSDKTVFMLANSTSYLSSSASLRSTITVTHLQLTIITHLTALSPRAAPHRAQLPPNPGSSAGFLASHLSSNSLRLY